MPRFPQQRFVRLQLPHPRSQQHTATFTAPPFVPDAGNSSRLAELGSNAELVSQRLAELASRSDDFLSWLERDRGNTRLFLEDPVTAIHQALPDLPKDFFEAWGTL